MGRKRRVAPYRREGGVAVPRRGAVASCAAATPTLASRFDRLEKIRWVGAVDFFRAVGGAEPPFRAGFFPEPGRNKRLFLARPGNAVVTIEPLQLGCWDWAQL